MDPHLHNNGRAHGNDRGGKGNKKPKSGLGPFKIDIPQYPQSSFEPEPVKKRQAILADTLSEEIIGPYGPGMSYGDISGHIKELYDSDISHTVPSQITDQIVPDVKARQGRPLEPLYGTVWPDTIHL